MFQKISLIAAFAIVTSSFLMTTSTAYAQADEVTGSIAFPNGCNALRFRYGNKQASVANPCDVEGRLSAIDLSLNDPAPEPVPEPTQEDYDAWVQFARTYCIGGANYTLFDQIVNRTGTFFCRDLDDPISLPNPAPTYFLGGLDFHHSDGLTSFSGLDLVETIPSIAAANSALTDLDGLRSLREVTSLDLDRNAITNINGLSNLETISYLDLAANQITSVAPLSNLTTTTMSGLILGGNQLTSLEGLSSLETITFRLDISNNPLENLHGLRNLKSVKEIVMASTLVKNFEGLENLTTVSDRILAWYNPNLENFDGLDGLTELNLNVWHTGAITDVSGLKNIASGSVSMTAGSRNSIVVRNPGGSPFCRGVLNGDMRITAGMYYYDLCGKIENPTLSNAWLDYFNVTCKLSSPINDLVAAETLNMGCAEGRPGNFPAPLPTKFGGLFFYGKGMTSLSGLDLLVESTNYLNFGQNQISDLSPLSNLKVVGDLRLESNQITDITPLQNLESVDWFYLHRNQITTVPFIPAFATARDIDLSLNEIDDISALSPLTSLQTVSFRDNNIASTRGLQNVTSVVNLNLTMNPLSDLTGLANISSGIVDLGYLYSGNFTPLSNNTPFCQAITSGAVTLGMQILSRVNAGLELCVPPADNGQWVWVNDNAISNTARTNVPAIAPAGTCAVSDGYVYTPYDSAGAFGPTSADACSNNIPYPSELGDGGNASLYATNSPIDGINNGFGVCHPANTYQCLDTASINNVWVITASVTEANFNGYSADARSAYLASHNLGEITRSFTIELENQLCLNAGDRYLRKVGSNYLSYSCGGVVPAGGAVPVPDVVCDVANGTDIGEPTIKGTWSPIATNQTFSFTQTVLADQQRNVSCYEGELNTATGEIIQSTTLLYEEVQTVEVTLSRDVQTRTLRSQQVLPQLCQPNIPDPQDVCTGSVYLQTGSCRFDPMERTHYFLDGAYVRASSGQVNQPTEFANDISRFAMGTGNCDHSGTGGTPPQFYPVENLTQCDGIAREYFSDENRRTYEMYWNGSLIKSGDSGVNGLVSIGEHLYFTLKNPNLSTGIDRFGVTSDITDYQLCRRDYSSNFDQWVHPDDHVSLTPAELEAIFFP